MLEPFRSVSLGLLLALTVAVPSTHARPIVVFQADCDEDQTCGDACAEVIRCENLRPLLEAAVREALPPPAPPACPGIPVATGGHPNGSEWILSATWHSLVPGEFAGPPIPTWAFFFSWVLGPSSLSVGADGFVAGAIVIVDGQELGAVKDGRLAQAGCILVGVLDNDIDISSFDYIVQGGSYGVSGTEECSHTTSITTEVGIEFSVQGPSGHVNVALGASTTCGASQTFDSEIIFGQEGSGPSFPDQQTSFPPDF